MTDVVMPKMGESITEGTILEWKKKIGDSIKKDEFINSLKELVLKNFLRTEFPNDPVPPVINNVLFLLIIYNSL